MSTLSLGWVGWQLLQQDAHARAQRAQEYAERQADRAVQSVERAVADAERQLSDLAARPAEFLPTPRQGGLLVVASTDGIRTSGTPRLLFHPDAQVNAVPTDPRIIDADAAELGRRDRVAAAALLRPLARDPDPTVRAAALLRLGRIQGTSRDVAGALLTFAALASLGETRVAGVPAGLAARVAEMQMLADLGEQSRAAEVARGITRGLADGRWPLTEAQFDHYLDVSRQRAGVRESDWAGQRVAAHTVTTLVEEASRGLPPSGRRSIAAGDDGLLTLWRVIPQGLVLWVVGSGPLLDALDVPVGVVVTHGTSSRLSAPTHIRATAVRHASETGLPWTLRASVTDAAIPGTGSAWRQLVMLGMGLLVLSLIVGFWLAGRAAQQELALARAQADFVSTVSHEFRTPLAAMRQLSEMLASGRVPTSDRRQQYYESLASESRRLQRLVENLLDFGRLQAGARAFTLEPVDTATLVHRVVEEFRSQPGTQDCTLEIATAPRPLAIYGDVDALALALHNLLDNAVKYSPGHARVTVSWRQEGQRVALSVRDAGLGISQEERERIFDRFVRGTAAEAHRVRGTGIGLALVKQVVESQGGEVGVESAPGEGSTFTVRLPLAARQQGDVA